MSVRFIIIYFFSIISLHASKNLVSVDSMSTNLIQEKTNQDIKLIYHELKQQTLPTLADKITLISTKFLGKPYQLKALGEGRTGYYDKDPLYRTDAFDCETYVDTVLALALADNQSLFQTRINEIRYRDGEISYVTRNHFTCVDWNKNNQKQGFIQDITTNIRDENHQPVFEIATALIDKPAWYQHATLETIHVPNASTLEKNHRLALLKKAGLREKRVVSRVAYIPISLLFDSKGHENSYLFKQIPNAAILEIVRPNWDLTASIGTHATISHLGFVIWQNNRLLFRNASSLTGKVVDQPLIAYLKKTQQSPTIKGINIQIVTNSNLT